MTHIKTKFHWVFVDFTEEEERKGYGGLGFRTTETIEQIRKKVENTDFWKNRRVPKIARIWEEYIEE